MLSATMKLFFRNHKKEVFDKIKSSADSVKKTAVQKMIEATNKKQINVLKLWMKNTKLRNKLFEHEANVRHIQKQFMNKLLNTKVGRIVDALKKWKSLPKRFNK